jgi:hypothetical protein
VIVRYFKQGGVGDAVQELTDLVATGYAADFVELYQVIKRMRVTGTLYGHDASHFLPVTTSMSPAGQLWRYLSPQRELWFSAQWSIGGGLPVEVRILGVPPIGAQDRAKAATHCNRHNAGRAAFL